MLIIPLHNDKKRVFDIGYFQIYSWEKYQCCSVRLPSLEEGKIKSLAFHFGNAKWTTRASNCGKPNDDKHSCWAWKMINGKPEITHSDCVSHSIGGTKLKPYHSWLRNGNIEIDKFYDRDFEALIRKEYD